MADDDEFVFSGTTAVADDPEPKRAPMCEVCGDDLHYGGRGRKPRFCEQHKPNRSSTTSQPRKSRGLDILRKDLESAFAGIGTGLCMIDLFDGTVVLSRSAALADSLVTLADRDPKIRKALEGAMRGGNYLQLCMVLFSIAGPIAWNHGLLRGVKEKDENGKTHFSRNPDLAPLMFSVAGIPAPSGSKAADE